MPLNLGTTITSTIRPLSSSMSIPTVISDEVMGGYHTVALTTDRDNIPGARRQFGMLVYTTTGNAFYQLKQISSPDVNDNTNWQLVNLNPVNSTTTWVDPVMSRTSVNPGTLTPVNGDRYLVVSGVGAWVGLDNNVVEWQGTWVATSPVEGMTLRVDNEEGPIYAFLSGVWTPQHFITLGTPSLVPYYGPSGSLVSDPYFFRDGYSSFEGYRFGNSITGVEIGSLTGFGGSTGSAIGYFNVVTNERVVVGVDGKNGNSTSGISYNIGSTYSGFYVDKYGPRYVTSNYNFGFPLVDGPSGSFMRTDGTGSLSFGFPDPVQVLPKYIIGVSDVVNVPDDDEYFIYGDLDVYGTLDIGTFGKVIVYNGAFSAHTGSSITNSGNISVVSSSTASNSLVGPVDYLVKYDSGGLTSSTAYYDNTGSFIIGTPSPFLTISNTGTMSIGTISSTSSTTFLMLDSNNNVTENMFYVNQLKTFGLSPFPSVPNSGTADHVYNGGTTMIGTWGVSADTFHDTSTITVDAGGTFSIQPGLYNIFINVNYTTSSPIGGAAPMWIQTHLKFLTGPYAGDFACVSRGICFYAAEKECNCQGQQVGILITSVSTFNVMAFNPSSHTFDNTFADIFLSFERIG